MYALRKGRSYVESHGDLGFNITETLNKAKMFFTIADVLQFVSLYEPDHMCGVYEIIIVQEVQRPRYMVDRVVE